MKDPVCGMNVDEKHASAISTYKGERYAFCGSECKDKFDKNPERYAHGHHEQKFGQHDSGGQHDQKSGQQHEQMAGQGHKGGR